MITIDWLITIYLISFTFDHPVDYETIQPATAAPPVIHLPIPTIRDQEGAVPPLTVNLSKNNILEQEGARDNIFPNRELGARHKVMTWKNKSYNYN